MDRFSSRAYAKQFKNRGAAKAALTRLGYEYGWSFWVEPYRKDGTNYRPEV
jgi:hypothetical protein